MSQSGVTNIITLPRDLAVRILLRLNTAASACKTTKAERDELRGMLEQTDADTISIPRDKADRILTRLKLTAPRFKLAAVERDELRKLLNKRQLATLDEGGLSQKVENTDRGAGDAPAPAPSPDVSSTSVAELTAQLTDLRRRFDCLHQGLKTIAAGQVPSGITIPDFASAAVADAQPINAGA
ncbi:MULTISPECIES: hypothetical protein [Pseudomonas]|jgi:hypothetical protein|uniref:Uncharacterized protein n=2 Tax=Pseudomonas TaxID=286 RepID=A0AAJ5V3U2_9PSED|nr:MULTISPECIES: hypothetical protein [Pseudomonas]MCT8164080.1 hypothetical protein [Pseudomonas sp. HD6422]MCT8182932.1 hypothetical protein [Pseudomonas sp. HD6421]MDH1930403.1 hypothetical protein [Pseudomonas sp. GD03696]MDM1711800.1 hypothetical protein [Pseudomonas sp. 165]ORL53099.1 hypothetical protein B7H18_03715 [Pseudomonas putida]